jgi:hypothetical protein
MIFADEDNAMVELGVGKNMVRSIRFWVEACGMAEPRKEGGLQPTWLGEKVFLHRGVDPYMEDSRTLWLMHWKLASNVHAPLLAWDFMFSRWQEPEFTESRIVKAFVRELESKERAASLVTLQQHFQVFLHTYVPTRGRKGELFEDNLDCPLTELEIIMKVGETESNGSSGRREPVYAFQRDDKPSITAGLFVYCVNDFWEKHFPNEQTLSVRSLLNGQGSPGQVFKIPEENVYARLTELADISGGKLVYSDSEALPQVQRLGPVKHGALLAQAFE